MQQIAERGYALPAQKYNKGFVIGKLKANLEKHKKDYEVAFTGFKDLVEETAKKRKAEFLRGLKKLLAATAEATPDGKSFLAYMPSATINISAPVSHASYYERAIAQLESSNGDEIELDDAAYTCFIDDQWEWKAQFQHMSQEYAGATLRKR